MSAHCWLLKENGDDEVKVAFGRIATQEKVLTQQLRSRNVQDFSNRLKSFDSDIIRAASHSFMRSSTHFVSEFAISYPLSTTPYLPSCVTIIRKLCWSPAQKFRFSFFGQTLRRMILRIPHASLSEFSSATLKTAQTNSTVSDSNNAGLSRRPHHNGYTFVLHL